MKVIMLDLHIMKVQNFVLHFLYKSYCPTILLSLKGIPTDEAVRSGVDFPQSKKYKATKGCIAIIKKDILKILPLISSNTKILIS